MTETEYLSLKKPSGEDYYNVEDFNENSEIIDEFAKGVHTMINLKDTVTQTQYRLGIENGIMFITDEEVV